MEEEPKENDDLEITTNIHHLVNIKIPKIILAIITVLTLMIIIMHMIIIILIITTIIK